MFRNMLAIVSCKLNFPNFFPLGVALLVSACAPLQSSEKDLGKQVDALFSQYDLPDSPGAAVGIFKDGKVVYMKGYGSADLEQKTPITPHTVFHVASVSKQFTAFAIALLAREGKVDLKEDIRTYLPYMPDFGQVITVEDLIHHTSGLRDQWLLLNMGGHGFKDYLSQEQILKLIAHQKGLSFAPGTDHTYSNTGYTLLAEIVSAVTGKSFREFTNERIFRPLGMADSFFFDDVSELIPGRAHSYSWQNAAPNDEKNDTEVKQGHWGRELLSYETVGATDLMTSVADMLKWGENFYHPVVGDRALIKQISTMGTLRDGTKINYGFGLQKYILGGHEAVLHTGGDAAFRSLFSYFPKEKFSVVILTNTPFDRFVPLRHIVDIYLNNGKNISDGDMPKEVVPDPAILDALEGDYLFENERMISFFRQGDTLMYRTRGSEPKPVIFRADNTFDKGDTSRSWSYYFLPKIPGNGKVQQIVEAVPYDDTKIIHKRITPIDPDKVDLHQYVGDYRNSELDTKYSVSVKDGALVAESLWFPNSTQLTPIRKDRFESPNKLLATIVFEHDAAGEVSGFEARIGRTNRISFHKIDPDCEPDS